MVSSQNSQLIMETYNCHAVMNFVLVQGAQCFKVS